MKATVLIGLLLLAIGAGAWADPPRDGEGRERKTPPEARPGEGRERKGPPEARDGARPGEPRHGEPGNPGERQGNGPGRGGDMAARMMQTMDADKDGTISFEEFRSVEKMNSLPEELQRNLFLRFDKNKDGTIARSELPKGPRPGGMAGPGEDFRKIDLNHDGRVSKPEFLRSPRVAKIPLEKRSEIFNRMDRNHDGFIDGRDHHRGPRPDGMPGRGRPPVDPAKFRADLDKNKDGAVSIEEFGSHPRFAALSEEQRADLFKKMDRNGDGRIDAADSPEGVPRERMHPRPEGGRGEHDRRGPDQAPDA